MYGYDHKRTEAQFETTWNELQSALPGGGFLLGATDNRLLLDGIPLEASRFPMLTAVWKGSNPWSDTTMTLLSRSPAPLVTASMMRATASFAV